MDFRKINLDFAGVFTSSLCAIHCAAFPILISLGSVSTAHWMHNHAFDWIVIGLGIIIAAFSLVKDYLQKHRVVTPLILGGLGFVLLIIGTIVHHGPFVIASVLGGLLVASAHLVNWRKSHTVSCAA